MGMLERPIMLGTIGTGWSIATGTGRSNAPGSKSPSMSQSTFEKNHEPLR